jgi:hypothetical protein
MAYQHGCELVLPALWHPSIPASAYGPEQWSINVRFLDEIDLDVLPEVSTHGKIWTNTHLFDLQIIRAVRWDRPNTIACTLLAYA